MLPPKCPQIVKKKKKLNILCFEKRIIQELSVEVFASMVIWKIEIRKVFLYPIWNKYILK